MVKGQKRFVVAASGADLFVVYCKTNPEGKPHERISLLLIEADRDGVEAKVLRPSTFTTFWEQGAAVQGASSSRMLRCLLPTS